MASSLVKENTVRMHPEKEEFYKLTSKVMYSLAYFSKQSRDLSVLTFP